MNLDMDTYDTLDHSDHNTPPLVNDHHLLPMAGGRFAPRTISRTGSSHVLRHFLGVYNHLCAHFKITSEREKCDGLLTYCTPKAAQMIERLPGFIRGDYESLIKNFKHFHDIDDDNYNSEKVNSFTKKWRKQKIDSKDKFKRYHRKYLELVGKALGAGHMSDEDNNRYFWGGIHQSLRKRIEQRMLVIDPELDVSIPFEMSQVVKAVEHIYNRHRFDQHLLENIEDSSDSDSESDIEVHKVSKKRPSSSESEDDEDSESDYISKKSSSRRKKKHHSEPKTSTKKDSPSKQETSPKKSEGDELAKLAQQMGELSLTDNRYRSLYVDIIREMLDKPQSQRSFVQQQPNNQFKRDLPPHLNMPPPQPYGPPHQNMPPPRPYGPPHQNMPPPQPYGPPHQNMPPPRPYGPPQGSNPGVPPPQRTEPYCFGCAKTGHRMLQCGELNTLLNQRIVVRNDWGKLQWPDGSPIRKDRDDSWVQAIERTVKRANIIQATTYSSSEESDDEETNQYVGVAREDEDASSDEQEDLGWLPLSEQGLPPHPLGFVGDCYAVGAAERTPRVSRDARKQVQYNLPGKVQRVKDFPKRSDAVGHQGQGLPINNSINNNSYQPGGPKGITPLDIHQGKFEAKVDDQLLPMDVDQVPIVKHRKEARKVPTDQGRGEITKIPNPRTNSGRSSTEIIQDVMKTPLTITLEEAVNISRSLQRDLTAASKPQREASAQTPDRKGATEKTALGANLSQSSELKRDSDLQESRDELPTVLARVGRIQIPAVIDSGSQVNVLSDRWLKKCGLPITTQNANRYRITGVNGGLANCLGIIPNARIYLTESELVTVGDLLVVEHSSFDLLLGRPWATVNSGGLREEDDTTYLSFNSEGRPYETNASPNSTYAKKSRLGATRCASQNQVPRQRVLTLALKLHDDESDIPDSEDERNLPDFTDRSVRFDDPKAMSPNQMSRTLEEAEEGGTEIGEITNGLSEEDEKEEERFWLSNPSSPDNDKPVTIDSTNQSIIIESKLQESFIRMVQQGVDEADWDRLRRSEKRRRKKDKDQWNEWKIERDRMDIPEEFSGDGNMEDEPPEPSQTLTTPEPAQRPRKRVRKSEPTQATVVVAARRSERTRKESRKARESEDWQKWRKKVYEREEKQTQKKVTHPLDPTPASASSSFGARVSIVTPQNEEKHSAKGYVRLPSPAFETALKRSKAILVMDGKPPYTIHSKGADYSWISPKELFLLRDAMNHLPGSHGQQFFVYRDHPSRILVNLIPEETVPETHQERTRWDRRVLELLSQGGEMFTVNEQHTVRCARKADSFIPNVCMCQSQARHETFSRSAPGRMMEMEDDLSESDGDEIRSVMSLGLKCNLLAPLQKIQKRLQHSGRKRTKNAPTKNAADEEPRAVSPTPPDEPKRKPVTLIMEEESPWSIGSRFTEMESNIIKQWLQDAPGTEGQWFVALHQRPERIIMNWIPEGKFPESLDQRINPKRQVLVVEALDDGTFFKIPQHTLECVKDVRPKICRCLQNTGVVVRNPPTSQKATETVANSGADEGRPTRYNRRHKQRIVRPTWRNIQQRQMIPRRNGIMDQIMDWPIEALPEEEIRREPQRTEGCPEGPESHSLKEECNDLQWKHLALPKNDEDQKHGQIEARKLTKAERHQPQILENEPTDSGSNSENSDGEGSPRERSLDSLCRRNKREGKRRARHALPTRQQQIADQDSRPMTPPRPYLCLAAFRGHQSEDSETPSINIEGLGLDEKGRRSPDQTTAETLDLDGTSGTSLHSAEPASMKDEGQPDDRQCTEHTYQHRNMLYLRKDWADLPIPADPTSEIKSAEEIPEWDIVLGKDNVYDPRETYPLLGREEVKAIIDWFSSLVEYQEGGKHFQIYKADDGNIDVVLERDDYAPSLAPPVGTVVMKLKRRTIIPKEEANEPEASIDGNEDRNEGGDEDRTPVQSGDRTPRLDVPMDVSIEVSSEDQNEDEEMESESYQSPDDLREAIHPLACLMVTLQEGETLDAMEGETVKGDSDDADDPELTGPVCEDCEAKLQGDLPPSLARDLIKNFPFPLDLQYLDPKIPPSNGLLAAQEIIPFAQYADSEDYEFYARGVTLALNDNEDKTIYCRGNALIRLNNREMETTQRPPTRARVDHMRQRLFRMGAYATPHPRAKKMPDTVSANDPETHWQTPNIGVPRRVAPAEIHNGHEMSPDELAAVLDVLMKNPIEEMEEQRSYTIQKGENGQVLVTRAPFNMGEWVNEEPTISVKDENDEDQTTNLNSGLTALGNDPQPSDQDLTGKHGVPEIQYEDWNKIPWDPSDGSGPHPWWNDPKEMNIENAESSESAKTIKQARLTPQEDSLRAASLPPPPAHNDSPASSSCLLLMSDPPDPKHLPTRRMSSRAAVCSVVPLPPQLEPCSSDREPAEEGEVVIPPPAIPPRPGLLTAGHLDLIQDKDSTPREPTFFAHGARTVIEDERGEIQTYLGHALIHMYPTNALQPPPYPPPISRRRTEAAWAYLIANRSFPTQSSTHSDNERDSHVIEPVSPTRGFRYTPRVQPENARPRPIVVGDRGSPEPSRSLPTPPGSSQMPEEAATPAKDSEEDAIGEVRVGLSDNRSETHQSSGPRIMMDKHGFTYIRPYPPGLAPTKAPKFVDGPLNPLMRTAKVGFVSSTGLPPGFLPRRRDDTKTTEGKTFRQPTDDPRGSSPTTKAPDHIASETSDVEMQLEDLGYPEDEEQPTEDDACVINATDLEGIELTNLSPHKNDPPSLDKDVQDSAPDLGGRTTSDDPVTDAQTTLHRPSLEFQLWKKSLNHMKLTLDGGHFWTDVDARRVFADIGLLTWWNDIKRDRLANCWPDWRVTLNKLIVEWHKRFPDEPEDAFILEDKDRPIDLDLIDDPMPDLEPAVELSESLSTQPSTPAPDEDVDMDDHSPPKPPPTPVLTRAKFPSRAASPEGVVHVYPHKTEVAQEIGDLKSRIAELEDQFACAEDDARTNLESLREQVFTDGITLTDLKWRLTSLEERGRKQQKGKRAYKKTKGRGSSHRYPTRSNCTFDENDAPLDLAEPNKAESADLEARIQKLEAQQEKGLSEVKRLEADLLRAAELAPKIATLTATMEDFKSVQLKVNLNIIQEIVKLKTSYIDSLGAKAATHTTDIALLSARFNVLQTIASSLIANRPPLPPFNIPLPPIKPFTIPGYPLPVRPPSVFQSVHPNSNQLLSRRFPPN